ncbi:hypothetical protein GCM10008908_00500 [Clostridium subterminale]|uniref:Uncharacterized protein n=1 Tax=Clostridium subterminale TaxID=1550 RepID=A0ABN1KFM2_CLOSU
MLSNSPLLSIVNLFNYIPYSLKITNIYVDVLAELTKEGVLKPREMIWEDGRHYEVDKITLHNTEMYYGEFHV